MYRYKKYAEDVVSGRITACQNIIYACRRYLSWFDRTDMYFDYAAADRVINFLKKLKHFEGKFAGQNFEPTPCQEWIVYGIFGWKWTSDNTRVINKALIMVARKFGKSFFAAGLALYGLLCDNEQAAQILNVASNKEQAKTLFRMEQILCKQIDPLNRYIKVLRDRINFDKTNSFSKVLASDADGLDSYGPSIFVCDETHAYKTSELWDVLISGQGARLNPLAINISTAGFNLTGFLYQVRQTAMEILRGYKTDDTLFAAIYELDDGDDYQDEKVWIKANPNLDITVTRKYLRDQVKSAINTPSLETSVKTKNFNIFCQSKTVWIPDKYIIDSMQQVNIEDFEGEYCWCGVDLSAVSDLTAWSICIPPNPDRQKWPDKFIFKTWLYIPESALVESINSELYKMWQRDGKLIVLPGNAIDYDYVVKDQVYVNNHLLINKIAYDSWQSLSWVKSAQMAGLPCYPYSQSLGKFSGPTHEIDRMFRKNNIIMDYNPVIRWCFQNCVLRQDWNGNTKPDKSANRDGKIDGAISMIESLGAWLDEGYTDNVIVSSAQ